MKTDTIKPKYDYLKLVFKHINGSKLTKDERAFLAALGRQASDFKKLKLLGETSSKGAKEGNNDL
jgi:hypothetical protein